jgi:hypothetical protein
MKREVSMRGEKLRLILAILFAAATLRGQDNLATLNGTVTDPTGAVIAGATVAAEHEETGLKRQVTTSAAGTYVLPQLPIGTWRVTI